MVKAVIFDLWSTLAFNDAPSSTITQIFESIGIDGTNPKNQRLMVESFMKKKYDTIEDGMRDFCRAFGKDEKLAKDLAKLWNDKVLTIRLFDDVLPTLRELKKRYKLGLITNTQSFRLGYFYEKKFFEIFDYACFSYEAGMLKPDPRIFRLTLKKLGVKPEDAVMIGDNLQSDVMGAEAVGIKGILIKRFQRKRFRWKEKGTWKRTITNLSELKKFL